MDFDIGTFLTGGGAGAGIFGTFLLFELKARKIFTDRITELEDALRGAHKETIECAELRGRVAGYTKVEALYEEMKFMLTTALSTQSTNIRVLEATLRPEAYKGPPSLEPEPLRSKDSAEHFFGRATHVDEAEGNTPRTPSEFPPTDTSPQTPLAKKKEQQ